MVTLQIFTSLPEAHIVKGLLEANDITTYLRSDDQGGIIPSTGSTSGIELMVLASDLEKAKKVLAEQLRKNSGSPS